MEEFYIYFGDVRGGFLKEAIYRVSFEGLGKFVLVEKGGYF